MTEAVIIKDSSGDSNNASLEITDDEEEQDIRGSTNNNENSISIMDKIDTCDLRLTPIFFNAKDCGHNLNLCIVDKFKMYKICKRIIFLYFTNL